MNLYEFISYFYYFHYPYLFSNMDDNESYIVAVQVCIIGIKTYYYNKYIEKNE